MCVVTPTPTFLHQQSTFRQLELPSMHGVFCPSQLDSTSQGWTPDISVELNRPYGQTDISELPTRLHLEAETLEATTKILTPNSCPQCLWLELEGQRQQYL